MGPIIELDNLVKQYGPVRALDGVTCQIGGGITGLLGPNGAGKTTLIKVLLGLVRFSSGTGRVLGYDLLRQGREIRSRVGFMPEDDCYVSGLSGIEMVQFTARLSGLPALEGLRRAHEILDFCGIDQERYREVDTYSTGMRQKLKFAQAIVHDPPLLILDEPTSGLDPEQRMAMLHRIHLLAHDAGKAVLLSTHILPDVQTICDNVVIMARGRIRVTDRLETLSRPTAPAVQVQVVGDPAALVACVRQDGGHVELQADGNLLISAGSGPVEARVWQWAQQSGACIRQLVPSRNSLEQIFLQAVGEDTNADS